MTKEVREIYIDFLKWNMKLFCGGRCKIHGSNRPIAKYGILYTYTMKG